jgi:hypothetical protein
MIKTDMKDPPLARETKFEIEFGTPLAHKIF